MRPVGIGDLATSYATGLQTSQLKSDLARLSAELASGQKADLKTISGSDISKYASIRNALSGLNSLAFSISDAAFFTDAAQTSLGTIRDLTNDLAPSLITFANFGTEPGVDLAAQDARGKLDSVIASLNTNLGDRSVFAGTSVDGPALADASTILADLTIVIAGETSASGVAAAVDQWFDTPGGGFETVGYLGADTNLAAFKLGAADTAQFGLRADSQELRAILKGYALASLVDEGALAGDTDDRIELVALAGEQLLSANAALERQRSELAVIQERIEVASVRNEAESTALELARTDLLAIDPYATATKLQSTETQLEALYALTARLSRLSLIDFLR